jgi:Flp pilus assembly protein TadG
MFNRIATSVRKVLSSRRGSVAIQMGLSIVSIIGIVGLGTEGTFLVYKQRQLQSATDSAAMSAVIALAQEYPRDPESEASAIAANLGFVNGVNGTVVTVNNPPTSGAYAGDSDAIEVIIRQPNTVSMTRLFSNKLVNVSARSVARQWKGRFCVLALDPSESQAMYMSNNAVLSSPDCDVAVNSSDASALYMRNNALINRNVITPGGADIADNAEIVGEIINAPAVEDPYADVQLGTPPPCDTEQTTSGDNNESVNLSPPVPGGPVRFCDGLDFKNGATVNLERGTYYIDSKLKLKNNAVLNGTEGVTIVINGNYAIDISNNAVLNITSPSDGNFAGIAFFGRRDATSNVTQKFENNTVMDIDGVVYFPNQILEFDNNGTTQPEGCTLLIARKVKVMNNVELLNDCDETKVKPISPGAKLVE